MTLGRLGDKIQKIWELIPLSSEPHEWFCGWKFKPKKLLNIQVHAVLAKHNLPLSMGKKF